MTLAKFGRVVAVPAFVFAALGVCGVSAHADVLVNVSGTPSALFNNVSEGVTWTLAGSYTDVSIAALASSASSFLPGGGTFYLTNSLGAGTTTANVVAETTVSGLGYEPAGETTLFSGLTLGPGTYYLISDSAAGTGGIAWQGLSAATVTTAPGATFGGELFALSSGAFEPAEDFYPLNSQSFAVNVTGVPAAVAAAPEPGSLALLGTGFLGLLGVARRRLA